MIEKKKPWLAGFPWDSVLALNRSLCQTQKMEPMVNPRAESAAKAFWSRAVGQTQSLAEALDVCRKTFEMSSLVFNNGNTFAAIGRSLVDDYIQAAPPVESQIIRSTIGHYIAGTVDRRELVQVLEHFDSVMKPAPVAPTVTATAPESTTPHLPRARAAV